MKTLVVGSVVLAFLAGSAAFAQRTGPRGDRPAGAATRDTTASPVAPSPAAAPPATASPAGVNDQRAARHEDSAPSLTAGGTVPYSYMVGGKHIDYKWQENGLSSPPQGYAWMLIGDSYILADQKSGLIKEVRKVSEQSVALTEGGKVPYSYMVGGKYIDYKWQENGLSPPPQGYAWMRIGGKFVLADQKSGVIKDIMSVDEARQRASKVGDRRP